MFEDLTIRWSTSLLFSGNRARYFVFLPALGRCEAGCKSNLRTDRKPLKIAAKFKDEVN